MRFDGGKAKAVTFSYDDGSTHDRRLIDIFNKNGLKATFNLNANRIETGDSRAITADEINSLYSGHEIACHCYTHGLLDDMQPAMLVREVFKDREGLERLTGKIIRGMAYPFGMTGGEVMRRTIEDCGIVYSRTVSSTRRFDMPRDMLLWNPTCHHDDPEIETLCDNILAYDTCADKFRKKPLLLYIWGHSFEFDTNGNWEHIEKIAAKLGGKEDIFYATNMEIYRCYERFNRLVFSLDGDKVFNPSADEAWINVDGENVKIAAGETKKI